jgi:hypothetical protein
MFTCKKEYSLKNKFKYFIDEINNIFLTEEQKDDFINVFCKIQKTYLALSKFAYIYKYKKAKIVVDFDLCLNPIDINNKNTICLFQKKYKFYFKINDLINIIDTALSNSPNFFSDSLISKNPYNNVPFNKSTLYNIYFNITEKTYIIPELIHKFFLCDFNLNKFEKEFEYLIREHAIQKYIKNSDIASLYNSVLIMLDYYNYTTINSSIKIHQNFPKKQLVDIMKPYLTLYFSHKYSLITTKKIQSKNILYKKLNDFYMFNPVFGRQQITVQTIFSKNKKIYKNIYTYNDKHISFYIDSKTFLTSHLSDK